MKVDAIRLFIQTQQELKSKADLLLQINSNIINYRDMIHHV